MYRYLKVDLVVVIVLSAVQSVFELMKLYEADGGLKIMPGVRFPFTETMMHDANAETVAV